MSQVITAIYEHGVLQPLMPLNLEEHQRVQVQILPETPRDKIEQVIQFLVRSGVLTPPRGQRDAAPVSETERRKLSEILGQATSKPLSEMIIEERGER